MAGTFCDKNVAFVSLALWLGGFALLLSLPGGCRAESKKSNWVEVQSPHFTVDSNSGKSKARATALEFEQIRAALRDVVLGSRRAQGPHLTILAVNGEESLKRLLPRYFKKKGGMRPAGIFTETPGGAYIVLRTDVEVPGAFEPVYHEYAHFVTRQSIPGLPLWLTEGLADFFSDTRFQGEQVYLGAPDAGNLSVLRSRPLLPLKTLLTVDHSSPYYTREDRVQIFYAESWALTHYLLLRDLQQRTNHVNEYADDVAAGGDPVGSFAKIFGPPPEVERALISYVQRVTFPAAKFSLPEDLSSKTFAVRALSAPEADAVKAEFLLSRGNNQEASRLLQKALRADSGSGKASGLMGELLLHQGDRRGAADWAAKAIKLDPQGYRGYFIEALARGGGAADAQNATTVEQDLERAIGLRPGLSVAEMALSRLYVDRGEKPARALALALDAADRDPESSACLTNLEVVLLQQDRQADAVPVELRMLDLAHGAEEQAALRNDLGWELLQERVAPSRADFEIRKAAELAPHSADVIDSLGHLLESEGDLAGAAAAYRRALAVNPKTLSSLEGLGDVLAAQHDSDGAASEYRAAISVNANDARAHYKLSQALRAEGKSAAAAQELKTAQGLDPFNSAYQ
ncbi:MAG: tetratricopeptide repeat protein [Terriglobia bacterium]